MAASVRYPKRKRTTISYAEATDPAEIDVVAHDDEDVKFHDIEFPAKKKKKGSKAKVVKEDTLTAEEKQRRATFPFMKLPGEIRNEIYKLCLLINRNKSIKFKDPTSDSPGKVEVQVKKKRQQRRFRWAATSTADQDKWRPFVPHMITNVLLISKQVHAEAAPFLYTNTFNFPSQRASNAFLVTIGPTNCKLLRRITFGDPEEGDLEAFGWRRDMFMTFQALSACTSLEQIHVHAPLERFYSNRFTVDTVEPAFVSSSRFAMDIWELCGHWFRAIALAQRNIFAGLDIFTFSDDVWEKALGMAGNAAASFTGEETATDMKSLVKDAKDSYDVTMRGIIRKKMSGLEADKDGLLPQIPPVQPVQ
ncbi:hypothetical protein BT63DRAFT_444039 [Microthyrium microscopicum]|uniref:Uncharacterized protein n=1 Tax=Microthyrium microscopicum TaxID=703497 RepID=A0A6A6TYM5_9PEZI|nr:hypothetical protein BT63DRAFT_444039 [Microthyrium microscopicum]